MVMNTLARSAQGTTLTKGLAVIEYLVACNSPKGVAEISRALHLTNSNTHRILQTLVGAGYVKRDPTRRYLSTARLWCMGCDWAYGSRVRSVAASEMEMLAHCANGVVTLAVREGLDAVQIHEIDATSCGSHLIGAYMRVPLHCSAVGKMLLATEFPELRKALVEPLPRYTQRTLTTLAELQLDILAVQKRGYALDAGEYRANSLSIAAPIEDGNQNTVAVIGIVVSAERSLASLEQELGSPLIKAAHAIAQKLVENPSQSA